MGGEVAAPVIPRAVAGALALTAGIAARASGPPGVVVSAVPEVASIQPGAAFRVAVRFTIPEGCHISWINPGQSGLPTTVAWRTPEGVKAAAVEWPFPERDETAGIVNHVYRGEAVVVTRFVVDSSFRGSAVPLRAELSWGVCGATCVPQKGAVDVSLPVRPGLGEPTAAWRALAPSLEALPVAASDLAVRAARRRGGARLTIAGRRLAPGGGTVVFFPLPGGAAVVAPARYAAGTVTLVLPAAALRANPVAVRGVLVARQPWLLGSHQRALAIEAPFPEAP